MHRDGLLTRLDTAFSRDQPEKVYVQHRMLENGPMLWSWLRDRLKEVGAFETRRTSPDEIVKALREAFTRDPKLRAS